MAEIIGTPGNDTRNGTPFDDTITGLGGNDRLNGRDGNDSLFGNAGNDRLFGGNGNDLLNGGEGNDRLSGQRGNDLLFGEDGRDNLGGGNGDDSLFGGNDRDTLRGDGGRDFLDGGEGDDVLRGGNHEDLLRGGDGDDRANGDRGDDLVFGGDGNDDLLGGDGDDLLDGGDDHDDLRGGKGRDLARGGAGDDDISGNRGNDFLIGDGQLLNKHAPLDYSEVYDGAYFDPYFPITGGVLEGGDDRIHGNQDSDIIIGDLLVAVGELPEGDLLTSFEFDGWLDGGTGNGFDGPANIFVALKGGNDRLRGDDGFDVVAGDGLVLVCCSPIPFLDVTPLDVNGVNGDPHIVHHMFIAHGGDDNISGGDGRNILFGDLNLSLPSPFDKSASTTVEPTGVQFDNGFSLAKTVILQGGDDFINSHDDGSLIFGDFNLALSTGHPPFPPVFLNGNAPINGVNGGNGDPFSPSTFLGGGHDEIQGGAATDVILGDGNFALVRPLIFDGIPNGIPYDAAMTALSSYEGGGDYGKGLPFDTVLEGGDDRIFGDGSSDVIFGDGQGVIVKPIVIDGEPFPNPEIASLDGRFDDFFHTLIKNGNDIIFGGDGRDLIFGDGSFALSFGVTEPIPSGVLQVGGDDLILAGDDDDIVFGDGQIDLYLPEGDDKLDWLTDGDMNAMLNDGWDNFEDEYIGLFEDYDGDGDSGIIGGNDIIIGGGGNDKLFGEGGYDLIIGDGEVAVVGSIDLDRLGSFDGETLPLVLHGGDDIIYGGDEKDLLIGDGQIAVVASIDIDLINGFEPNGILAPLVLKGGNDWIDGGNEKDLIIGDGQVLVLAPFLGGGGGLFDGPPLAIIENGDDHIYGADEDDLIIGDGSLVLGFGTLAPPDSSDLGVLQIGGNDSIEGNDGNDTVFADGMLSIYKTYDGTGDPLDGLLADDSSGWHEESFGEDYFAWYEEYGSSGIGGDDTVDGGDGDDKLFGEGGDDLLNGGAGNDFVDVGDDDSNQDRVVISDVLDGVDLIANFDAVGLGATHDVLDLDTLFDKLELALGLGAGGLDTAARTGRVTTTQIVDDVSVTVDASLTGDGSVIAPIAVIQDVAVADLSTGAGADDDIFVGA